MPHVITLTGPSRAGKSTTIRYILAYANESFSPQLVPKYTTRPRRGDDNDDEVVCVEGVPDQCDLVYELYGVRYGLETRAISDLIDKGQSPIVVLNDVRVVEDVRTIFSKLVRSVFISRDNLSDEQYKKELIESRGEKAGEIRFEKARTIYRIYIENIHLFDHVIINSGTLEELELQAQRIVKGLEQERNWPLRRKGAR